MRTGPHKSSIVVLIAFCAVLPVIVAFSLFVPVIAHYYVPTVSLSDADVDTWLQYTEKNRALIEEVNAYRVMGIHGEVVGDAAVRVAEELLKSNLGTPGESPSPDQLAAIQDPLLRRALANQLQLSSLVVCDFFLEAHNVTGNDKYFAAAIDYAIAFAEHEQSMWLPDGFNWNDHAIALRVPVISRLLIATADRRDDDNKEVVRSLLVGLDRAVRLLAKRRQFTYRSNHGLMQSMGVMHAAIVAPELSGVRENLGWILDRTNRQLKYFVSSDGVIIEHSSGYQEFGLGLFAVTLKYATILSPPLRDDWRQRYRRALGFYDHILRPDDTLPRHGDTHGKSEGLVEALISKDGASAQLLRRRSVSPPDSVWMSENFGYWSERQSGSHHLATWAYFVAGAHKHADELSTIFWMDGEEWWTAGGYWAYGRPIRKQGIGWNGSNAPHFRDEHISSKRASSAKAWYSDESLSFLHLNRTADDGYSVDRTVLRVSSDIWLVIDASNGNPKQLTDSVWQTMPSVTIDRHPGDESLYRLQSSKSASKVDVQLLYGPGATAQRLNASRSPFGGWISKQGIEHPAEALMLTAPVESWSGLVWVRQTDASLPVVPVVDEIDWESVDSWTIRLQVGGVATIVSRNSSRLSVDAGNGAHTHELETAGERRLLVAAEKAFAEMQDAIPPHRDYLASRAKTLKLALLASALQLLVLLVLARWLHSRRRFALGALTLLATTHLAFGAWLHAVYFGA